MAADVKGITLSVREHYIGEAFLSWLLTYLAELEVCFPKLDLFAKGTYFYECFCNTFHVASEHYLIIIPSFFSLIVSN